MSIHDSYLPHGETGAEQWENGYALGSKAKVGDDLPHPQDCHVWYHAIRAALWPRGLDLSLFMRVIPHESHAHG